MISCAFATQFSHMWPSAPAISICTSSLERLQNEQRIFDSFIAYKCTIQGAKDEGKKGYPVMNEVPFFSYFHIGLLLRSVFLLSWVLAQYVIDDAILFSFVCSHPVVTIRVLFHFLNGLAAMGGDDFVQLFLQLNELTGSDFDIGCLSFCSTMRLVNHNSCMFQSGTLAFCTSYQQYSAKRGCHTGTDSGYIRSDDLHGVINT